MTTPTQLVWLRHDLRLVDNPAIFNAAAAGPVAAVYIYEPLLPWAPLGASLWWLHHSLKSLMADLKRHGVQLILRKGKAEDILPKLAKEILASAIYWNRPIEPAQDARDEKLAEDLRKFCEVKTYRSGLLFQPSSITNKEGNPYKVFTPFANACRKAPPPPPPKPAPDKITAAKIDVKSDELEDWGFLPTRPNWAKGFDWEIGEKAAQERLADFLDEQVKDYTAARDRPDKDGTSKLSPHLHFGEISPRQIWHAVEARAAKHSGVKGYDKFLSEILWREFSSHLLLRFPSLPSRPLDERFTDFPWQPNKKYFDAWCKGQTGMPIVDAGMRQLWQTGWMHNRVRMIVASFLIKNLQQDWRKGEAWFWDCLVDADLANNAASWQWVAGCGADAAPYYRIFNPVLQGEKFDPNGDYVREFVSEIKALSNKFIHAPWQAPADELNKAGIKLGQTYPAPIVDLGASRKAALDAFKRIKNESEAD